MATKTLSRNYIYKNTQTVREVNFRGTYDYEYIFEYENLLFKRGYATDRIHIYKDGKLTKSLGHAINKKSFVNIIHNLFT